MKTAFLQRRKIKGIVYLHHPKEANTSKVWKLQKCVYGLSDSSRYWYLQRTVQIASKDKQHISRTFNWRQNNTLIGILACHVDNMIWGGDHYFKGTIITKLKERKKCITLVLKK